jgi:organic hydroperoxide reductase OsmC/OhrA
MPKSHNYKITTKWTGNLGSGTANYRAYNRDHQISAVGKGAPVNGSSDPHFRGDATRYNPEELLVASLSSCHMLWVLHLCADAGIAITEYSDEATGVMAVNEDGSGQFTLVTLRPRVTITDRERTAEANAVHAKAHELCFIARSVNFPVKHEPVITAVPAVV